MKRKNIWIFTCTVAFFFVTNSFVAQYGYLKAGLNFNTANVKDINTGERLSAGVNAGLKDYSFAAGLGLKVKDKMYFQLGLEWMAKGYRNKFAPDPWDRNQFWGIWENMENHKVRSRMYYIGIPITAAYYITVKDLRFFVQGGVFTAFGLLGNERISGKIEGNQRDEHLAELFFFGELGAAQELGPIYKKRGDGGLILGLGFELDDFQFGVQYQRSFGNIAFADYDLRNRSVSLYVLANIDLRSPKTESKPTL